MRRSAALLLAAAAAAAAHADVVRLRNGETMEGVVTHEDAKSLELDIGYGTVTLDKATVRRVERAKKKGGDAGLEERLKRLESGRDVPESGRELYALYQAASRARDTVNGLKPAFDRLLEDRASLIEELGQIKAQGADAYGEVVDGEANDGHRRLAYGELRGLEGDFNARVMRLQAIDAELNQGFLAVPAYTSAYLNLERYSRGEGERLAKAAQTPEEKAFFRTVRDAAARMDKDFDKGGAVGRSQGTQVVVDVLLNGRVTAPLVVDTGASITVLTRSVVERLGLSERHMAGVMQMQVADGRVVESQTYNLDSVSVGGHSAQRVLVAVMPDGALPLSGLLGMSFLKSFVFEVDPKQGRLVLKGLN